MHEKGWYGHGMHNMHAEGFEIGLGPPKIHPENYNFIPQNCGFIEYEA